jgi:CRISPR-associated protein Cmr4
MTNTHLYFLHALSPLHAGTGQGTGVIDLPIAREKATGIPYLAGSSIKGVLRDKSMPWVDKNKTENQIDPQLKHQCDVTFALFGPPTERADEQAGSLQVSDARLLLFPVRSLRGTFAWVSSPYILSRFIRDITSGGIFSKKQIPVIPYLTKRDAIWVNNPTFKVKGNVVVLEDLDLTHHDNELAKNFYNWLYGNIFQGQPEQQTLLKQHFAIVHDDVMNFLLRNATEIVARIRLEAETKTVARGALWYEESLPSESLLYGMMTLNPTKKARELKDQDLSATLTKLAQGVMQFGGKSTVGRGLCQVHLVGGK